MADPTTKSNGTDAPLEKKVEELYALIDGIEIAMMTTRLTDGYLVSRPMATQARREGVDLWFMTDGDTHKVDEIERDPHVNLGYYKAGEWVSVSGVATVVRDRARIRELYQPDWRAWLGDEGGARNGGPDDPRIALIEVRADSVTYVKRTQPRPVLLFNVMKAMVTGERVEAGETRHLEGSELRSAR